MDAARLRTVASVTAVGVTAGLATVIGADPLPAAPSTLPAAAGRGGDPPTGLIARERRAVARLELAERRLRSIAAGASAPVPAAAVPAVVALAPPAAPAVTSTGSS